MDDEKKRFLQALKNVSDKRKSDISGRSGLMTPDLKSQNLAKGELDKDILKVKGSAEMADLTPGKMVIGKTEKIDTIGDVVEKTDINDFSEKLKDRAIRGDLKATMADAIKRGDTGMIKKLQIIGKKLGGKSLKALPIVGSLAGLAGAENASAALPILGDAESAGESPEIEREMLDRARYMQSPATKDRLRKLAELNNKK